MNTIVATVQHIYEAFGKGDIPAILDHVAEDVEWEQWADNTAQKAGVSWLQHRHGKEGVAEFFGLIGTELMVTEFEVLSMMSNETKVTVEFMIACNVTSTGGYFRDEEMHLWTFNKEGKVTHLRHYVNTAKHMKAAGKY